MAYYLEQEGYLQDMIDPSQFMYWNKEDRPYHMMGAYGDTDSDSDGISGEMLEGMLHMGNMKPNNRLCKFYQKGNCRYGSRCRYVHSREGRAERSDICVFHQKGYCRYGQDCKFKHGEKTTSRDLDRTGAPTEEQPYNPNSAFSVSDDDLKAGRLTRLKMCLDVPIEGSASNPKPLHHGSHYIEVFVNKREDDVQYLYNVLIEKANHPLFQMGTFEFCKPGTNCDLSDYSMKLKDTSLFIFGNCVEVLFQQSFKLASIFKDENQKQISNKEDIRRYASSKLPRNADGTFKETNLRSLIKDRGAPDHDELFPKESNSIKVKSEEFENCEEPAKHFELAEKYNKYVKIHDKIDCQWCTEMGCPCLAESLDQFDSDDSEWSIDSKSSRADNAKTSPQKNAPNRYSCGAYPDELKLSSILDILQKNGIAGLKFGDVVTFGESRDVGSYVLGKGDKLSKLNGPDSVVIPFEVTMYLMDATKKYEQLLQKASNQPDDVIGIYLRHDDKILTNAFDEALPSAWKYCMVSNYGATVADLSNEVVQYVQVEFNDSNCINIVAPGHKLAEENSSFLSNIQEVIQKYQSTKETANPTSFEIELCLSAEYRQKLIEARGTLEPQILSWFVKTISSPNIQGSTINLAGPTEEVEIVKAIVEEYYEGYTWRYGRKD